MAETNTREQRKKRFEEMQKELSERGRDVWLAGLGALATMEEEGAKLFNRLVERGEAYERSSAQQLEELSERVSEQQKQALERAEETTRAAQSAIADAVDRAFERFGVPTRGEVNDLSEKVDRLSQQVETLAKQAGKEEK